MSVLLFDIGGTNTRMAIGEGETVRDIRKIRTTQNPDEVVSALVAFAKESAEPVTSVSGGMPGVVENNQAQPSPNLPGWKEFAIASTLHDALGVPVHLINDAQAAGLGEAIYGAGKGHELVAYIGLGTGIGGTFIVRGAIAPHAHGFEPGRQILDAQSGTRFEQLVSGSALENRFGMAPKDIPASEYEKIIPSLAAGLANVILEWSPEILVLGGSLMNEGNGFRLADIQSALESMAPLKGLLPVIAQAALGDNNGLYGVLALAR